MFWKTAFKHLRTALILAVLASSIHSYLFETSSGQSYELSFADLWFKIRGTVPPPDDVVIIAMDEASYRNLSTPLNQPWPRELHAQLLEKLKAYGVRRVLFDVLFLGASADASADAHLAQSFSLLPTVIGVESGKVNRDGYDLVETIFPYEVFREKVETMAFTQLPEKNGQIRSFFWPDEKSANITTLAAAAAYVNIGPDTYPEPQDLVNFYGPSGTIPTYSYYQVMETEHEFPRAKLEGKTVFVGLMTRSDLGPAQKDSFLTSFDEKGRTFGVEIHATAAANIMHQNWIHRFPKVYERWALLAFFFVIASIIVLSTPLIGAVILLFIVGAWAGTSYWLFLDNMFIPGALALTIVAPTTFVGSTLFHYFITWRSREHIRKAFAFYLSPEMAKNISKNPGLLKLGGEMVNGTALFTDIIDFTTISERMSPEEVTHMLNEYFTEVMAAIFVSQGTLVKFIGDSAFAIWGAPVKVEDHAARASRSALQIQEAVTRFNAKKKYPNLLTRVGIATGPMVCGNLGSEKRFDFTAIGDTVNVASRLEGLNKYFGTSILITDTVAKGLDSSFHLIEVGYVSPKGKELPTQIYYLLNSPVSDELSAQWRGALNKYKQKQWQEALAIFAKMAEQKTVFSDVAAFYVEEVNRCIQFPPPADWKGEITFMSK